MHKKSKELAPGKRSWVPRNPDAGKNRTTADMGKKRDTKSVLNPGGEEGECRAWGKKTQRLTECGGGHAKGACRNVAKRGCWMMEKKLVKKLRGGRGGGKE